MRFISKKRKRAWHSTNDNVNPSFVCILNECCWWIIQAAPSPLLLRRSTPNLPFPGTDRVCQRDFVRGENHLPQRWHRPLRPRVPENDVPLHPSQSSPTFACRGQCASSPAISAAAPSWTRSFTLSGTETDTLIRPHSVVGLMVPLSSNGSSGVAVYLDEDFGEML